MRTDIGRSAPRRFGTAALIAAIVGGSLALLANWSVRAAAPASAATFEIPYSPTNGRVIDVGGSGSLQSALDSAVPGDTIVLQAGATYKGPFNLPYKPNGKDWIYVRSSAYDRLPPPGQRVKQSDVASMPRLISGDGGGAALTTADRAHHFRFVGISFSPQPSQFVHALIRIGNADRSESTLPEYIVFDRCDIRSDETVGGRRGVAMDGRFVAVIDSRITGFKERGADSQGLWAYNTPGPLKIVNNFVEAAGENILFGGADPALDGVVPSDIEIRRNHLFKPLEWRRQGWVVKNLLEFKSAQRVLVEGNILQNNWAGGQTGYALLITPRNQDGNAPWTVTQDIVVRYNRFENVAQGVNILGSDDIHPSRRTSRVLIEHNLILVTDNGGLQQDRLFQVVAGPDGVKINNNTGFSKTAFFIAENEPRAAGFIFDNNIVARGEYGFSGSGSAEGVGALRDHFIEFDFAKNALVGTRVANYPIDNFFYSNITEIGFVDYAGGNFRLAATSKLKGAGTDGQDVGADIDLIDAAIAGSQTVTNDDVKKAPSTKPMPPSKFKVGS